MLQVEDAKRVLHGSKLSSRDRLLVLLALDPGGPCHVRTVKQRCAAVGLPKLANMNLSDILGSSIGFVARTPEGWELQQPGVLRMQAIAQAANVNLVVTHSSQSLQGHVESLTDPLTKSFVMEAVNCFRASQYRAAVVFSWAGAVALLHRHVFNNKLDDFNNVAPRHDPKWRIAKQQDDLGRMREHDFLTVCEAIGVIGKSVRQILQNECLMLRNACGHPNSASIAENSVAAHIEKLIKNVFSKF
ncbi:MAG TPA: hypothetical protein VFG04_24115 [Planctomycetaceae bacterium]|nr:hypothetical protein [Planctomycetaceae bacterium]